MSEDAYQFAHRLLNQGLSLVVYENQLLLSPKHAYKYLSLADQHFIRDHREALKALVPRLPLPSVIFRPPGSYTDPLPRTLVDVRASCSFCRRPCVGINDPWYPVFHANDPARSDQDRDSPGRSPARFR